VAVGRRTEDERGEDNRPGYDDRRSAAERNDELLRILP
jgi:hypothetical protein